MAYLSNITPWGFCKFQFSCYNNIIPSEFKAGTDDRIIEIKYLKF